jgi:hypothetical protein
MEKRGIATLVLELPSRRFAPLLAALEAVAPRLKRLSLGFLDSHDISAAHFIAAALTQLPYFASLRSLSLRTGRSRSYQSSVLILKSVGAFLQAHASHLRDLQFNMLLTDRAMAELLRTLCHAGLQQLCVLRMKNMEFGTQANAALASAIAEHRLCRLRTLELQAAETGFAAQICRGLGQGLERHQLARGQGSAAAGSGCRACTHIVDLRLENCKSGKEEDVQALDVIFNVLGPQLHRLNLVHMDVRPLPLAALVGRILQTRPVIRRRELTFDSCYLGDGDVINHFVPLLASGQLCTLRLRGNPGITAVGIDALAAADAGATGSKLASFGFCNTDSRVTQRTQTLQALASWLQASPRLRAEGLSEEEAALCCAIKPGIEVLRRIQEVGPFIEAPPGSAAAATGQGAADSASSTRRRAPSRSAKRRAIERVRVLAPLMDKK